MSVDLRPRADVTISLGWKSAKTTPLHFLLQNWPDAISYDNIDNRSCVSGDIMCWDSSICETTYPSEKDCNGVPRFGIFVATTAEIPDRLPKNHLEIAKAELKSEFRKMVAHFNAKNVYLMATWDCIQVLCNTKSLEVDFDNIYRSKHGLTVEVIDSSNWEFMYSHLPHLIAERVANLPNKKAKPTRPSKMRKAVAK